MNRRISQREARKLRKRVGELETALYNQRRTWSQEYVGGVNVATAKFDDPNHAIPVSVRTARKLGHAVVVVGDDSGTLRLMALPLAKV